MEAESLAEVSKVNMEIELIKKEYSKKIQEIESYCIKKDLIHLEKEKTKAEASFCIFF